MERPEKIAVVDASVAVKWFVEEEYSHQALAMAEDYRSRRLDLRSTQLLPFEVLNALRYNPDMGLSEVARAGDALSRLGIGLHPVLGELKDACLRAALERGLTVYDASYLSLAELLGCKVYTADSKLVERGDGGGAVRHLRDYPVH